MQDCKVDKHSELVDEILYMPDKLQQQLLLIILLLLLLLLLLHDYNNYKQYNYY